MSQPPKKKLKCNSDPTVLKINWLENYCTSAVALPVKTLPTNLPKTECLLSDFVCANESLVSSN